MPVGVWIRCGRLLLEGRIQGLQASRETVAGTKGARPLPRPRVLGVAETAVSSAEGGPAPLARPLSAPALSPSPARSLARQGGRTPGAAGQDPLSSRGGSPGAGPSPLSSGRLQPACAVHFMQPGASPLAREGLTGFR